MAAAQYDASRPSYPPALFDFLEEFIGRPLAGIRVADVGAGTGIAYALLRRRGADVIAVEPGEAMATAFRRALPGVPIVRGDGNALPLADSSHDLITYARSTTAAPGVAVAGETSRIRRRCGCGRWSPRTSR